MARKSDPLATYNAKRDFARTAEPSGQRASSADHLRALGGRVGTADHVLGEHAHHCRHRVPHRHLVAGNELRPVRRVLQLRRVG